LGESSFFTTRSTMNLQKFYRGLTCLVAPPLSCRRGGVSTLSIQVSEACSFQFCGEWPSKPRGEAERCPEWTPIPTATVHILWSMTHSQPKPFKCPNCSADYKVVRVEAPVSDAFQEITCKSCRAPFGAVKGARC